MSPVVTWSMFYDVILCLHFTAVNDNIAGKVEQKPQLVREYGEVINME